MSSSKGSICTFSRNLCMDKLRATRLKYPFRFKGIRLSEDLHKVTKTSAVTSSTSSWLMEPARMLFTMVPTYALYLSMNQASAS